MDKEEIRKYVLDHAKSSRNGIFPTPYNLCASLKNPLCGDWVEIKILAENQIITKIGYEARACAICSASASLMSESCEGKSFQMLHEWIELFETSLSHDESSLWPLELEHLRCFSHLRKNITRRVCALLPWVTLRTMLKSPINEIKQ